MQLSRSVSQALRQCSRDCSSHLRWIFLRCVRYKLPVRISTLQMLVAQTCLEHGKRGMRVGAMCRRFCLHHAFPCVAQNAPKDDGGHENYIHAVHAALAGGHGGPIRTPKVFAKSEWKRYKAHREGKASSRPPLKIQKDANG